MPPRKASRAPPPPSPSTIDPLSVQLQEQFHKLLTRLSVTVDNVTKWPSSAGDNKIHMERTAQLISDIQAVLKAIQGVETIVQSNSALRQRLNNCRIPVDLLDLLDHGGGLNPECFARGLLEEAAGQLQGLNRRKVALERLGAAVHAGLKQKQKAQQQQQLAGTAANKKRTREEGEEVDPIFDQEQGEEDEEEEEGAITEPSAKKANT